jgi:hypothetical protein
MDPPQYGLGLRTWIRVKDQTNGLRINLGFSSGLIVGCNYADYAHDCLAIAPEQKFFGN